MKGRSCSDAPPPQAARGCPTSCVGRSTGGQHSNADEQAVEVGPREGVPTPTCERLAMTKAHMFR